MAGSSPSNLYGLVDMGSNGIRFSISDLSPPSARALPTVFQDRAGISLFDAQYISGERGPIPQNIIDDVLSALAQFQIACADFGVPETNIIVLATEATRTAVNSEDYRKQIKNATGWEVQMLPKEAEGRIGAMGVASSFSAVEGLVMDLGGGSTQITWMLANNGKVQISPKGSFSFPYGAAALTRKLAEIDEQGPGERKKLEEEMKANFVEAYHGLQIPESLLAKAAAEGGFTLYLSGGGFRGWGYLLMSEHRTAPYPIPIINGFQVSKRDFQNTMNIQDVAANQEIFRVSQRRSSQVPAVAFLVNVLVRAIPSIKEVRFCQGGVREGFLFDSLDEETRSIDPLTASTARLGPPSSAGIAELLMSALPPDNLGRTVSSSLSPAVVRAFADMLYFHSPLPKESTTLAALYSPITGILASAHGISHLDRALLALLLCHRWDGELAPPHDLLLDRLHALLTRQEVFWCNYLGKVADLVGGVYPAGKIGTARLGFRARWQAGLGKKGLEEGVKLVIARRAGDPMTTGYTLQQGIDKIEKVGKKKQRIGGKDGYGVPVDVSIEDLP